MGYSTEEFVAASIITVLATSSLFASTLTIKLLYAINMWNGYMILVYNLTVCQAIFDASFYFLIGFRNPICLGLFRFLTIFSGSAVTLWTNVISTVICYIVAYRKSFNLAEYMNTFNISIVITSLLLSVAEAILYASRGSDMDFTADSIYYWFRLVSIVVNIINHLIITYHLQVLTAGYYQVHKGSISNSNPTSNIPIFILLTSFFRKTAVKANPLEILSSRLKYYPLVQIFSRLGASWWEFQYGFRPNSFDSGSFTPEKTVSFYMYAICNPSAGLGYFLVFLIVQPLAYEKLKMMLQSWGIVGCCNSLCCYFRCCYTKEESQLSTDRPTFSDSFSQFRRSFKNSSVDSVQPSSSTETDSKRPGKPMREPLISSDSSLKSSSYTAGSSAASREKGSFSISTSLTPGEEEQHNQMVRWEKMGEEELAREVDRQFSTAGTGSSVRTISEGSVGPYPTRSTVSRYDNPISTFLKGQMSSQPAGQPRTESGNESNLSRDVSSDRDNSLQTAEFMNSSSAYDSSLHLHHSSGGSFNTDGLSNELPGSSSRRDQTMGAGSLVKVIKVPEEIAEENV